MISKTSHALDGTPGVEVVRVSDGLGAEIRGVDLAGDMDAALFGAIYRAWLDHLVLIFRGQTLSDSALYKSRWQVELFFKWIKQHLRIKQFYGTSENAVKTQIWIAVSVYVLVAIVKKRLDLDASLYTLLQILSVTLFEKMPIHQALAGDENRCNASQITNQLNLFDF